MPQVSGLADGSSERLPDPLRCLQEARAGVSRPGASGPLPAARSAAGVVTRPDGCRYARARRISLFLLAHGQARSGLPGPGKEPGCEVELTEILAAGQAWWSLGFETTGPASLLREELEAAAALVFAQAMPGGLELGAADSRSYADWRRRQPGIRTDAEP